jgi:hypothetical protein
VTDVAGSVEWAYSYDPYGNARSATKIDPSAPTLPARFRGHLQDDETGCIGTAVCLERPLSILIIWTSSQDFQEIRFMLMDMVVRIRAQITIISLSMGLTTATQCKDENRT